MSLCCSGFCCFFAAVVFCFCFVFLVLVIMRMFVGHLARHMLEDILFCFISEFLLACDGLFVGSLLSFFFLVRSVKFSTFF